MMMMMMIVPVGCTVVNLLRRRRRSNENSERVVRYVVLDGCGNSYAFLRRECCGYGNLRRMAREMSEALRTDGIVVVEDAMNKECDVRMRIFNKDLLNLKFSKNLNSKFFFQNSTFHIFIAKTPHKFKNFKKINKKINNE